MKVLILFLALSAAESDPGAGEATEPAPLKKEEGPGLKTGEGERPTPLTDVEKARLIKENRKEARDALARFQATGERDIELLEKYADLHRKNIAIAPTTCPKCWAELGEALSMLGWKYWSDDQALLEEIKKADPARADVLRLKAKDLRAKWKDFFTRSNQAYETHFRLSDKELIHPYSFERVMRHCELLGNYERALHYLKKCMESYPSLQGGLDPPRKEKFEKLRRIYEEEIEKQKAGKVIEGGKQASKNSPDHN